jgi:AraC-like DNA-binding protein
MKENLKIKRGYAGFLYLAESARNPPTMRSHHHVELELNLVVRGTISYVVGGRRHTFCRRTLLWLYPTQEHQLVERSNDAQYYVAVFTPAFVARLCQGDTYAGLRRSGIAADGVRHVQLDPEAFDLARTVMDTLMVGAPAADILNRELGFGVNSKFHYEHYDPMALNAGLQYLLLFCWRCQRRGRASVSGVALHPGVRKALELLSGSPEEMGAARLAVQCGMSEAHLSRLFARQMGMPLNRYRNSIRLRRFFDYYRSPVQKTMLESMYAAGFGSYAQFHRVFTDAYGCGPRAGLHAIEVGPSERGSGAESERRS